MHRVVITGYGAISPIGKCAKDNWESLLAGRSGIRRVSLFDVEPYPCKIAGEISDFDPKNHFIPKEIKRMDRFIQFCLVAGKEALESSGVELEKENPTRVGTSIGVGMGGLITIEQQYQEILNRGPRRVTPFFIPMIIPNLAAGQLAIKYGLKGPNTCVTTACSSSAHSIGESFRLIQRGDVDIMFAGGAESVICVLGFSGFCAARALTTKNEIPEKASRPFDKGRDGFVMGEGSAVLILEEYEHAKKRGADILAEIAGYGLNCDASHITQPSPDGDGAARCMQLALKDASMNVDEVDYINAHGTSTPIGDAIENTAVKSIFGDHAKKLCMSSTKSMTGHLLGAAGAVEALYCTQALENQAVPPTINLDSPDDAFDLDYVAHEAQQRSISTAISNSFGFGGTNASLIFKKAD